MNLERGNVAQQESPCLEYTRPWSNPSTDKLKYLKTDEMAVMSPSCTSLLFLTFKLREYSLSII